MKTEFEFKIPHKKKLIIYTPKIYQNSFDKLFGKDIYYLFPFVQKINLIIYTFARLISIIKRKKFILVYFQILCFFVKPKVILTTFDNYDFFYSLKNLLKNNIKLFVIQNNWYGGSYAVKHFNKDKKYYKCDEIFIFGKCYENFYRSRITIKDKIQVIGSFRANFSDKTVQNHIDKRSLNYISQFRPVSNYKGEDTYPLDLQKSIIKFLDNYSLENDLILNIFCKYNNNELMNANNNFIKMEENFYKSLNLKTKHNLIISNEINDNFKKLLQKDIIITNDSTLGYELFAFEKKVAFFTIRNKEPYVVKFGWPAEYTSGKFWTNIYSENNMRYILDWLRKIEKTEWLEYTENIRNNLISKDLGNKKLVKHVTSYIKK